jgi:AcrR family transcriptional regulator
VAASSAPVPLPYSRLVPDNKPATARKSRGNTRERLLDEAFTLFVERGFDGTPITDVERAAGLLPGNGSFYRHFGSKDELLRAAIERELTRILADGRQSRSELQIPDDPREAQLVLVKHALQMIRRGEALLMLMLTEGDRVSDLREALADSLRSNPESEDWISDPSTSIVIAALTGFNVFRLASGGKANLPDEDAFIEALIDVAQPRPTPSVAL